MEQEKLTRLIKQARQGDQSAQEALLAAVQDRVYYHCKKMLKHEQDAQDAAQDVLIAVLTGLDKLREPGAFWGWVNGITANRCRHLLSAPHKEWQIPEDEEGNSMLESVENLDQTLVPEAVLDDGETRRMILELVDALPPEQRMSVLFYYYDEMSVKDIAQAMEVSEGTVKSRLNYARKSIRSGVEEYERKGVKLYSLSPLVLLVLFLRQEADGMQLPPQAAAALSGKVLAGAKEAATSTAAAEGTAAGSAATGGNAAATAAKAGLSTKVIAGIVAGALLIGGGALGLSSMTGRDNGMEQVPMADDISQEDVQVSEPPVERRPVIADGGVTALIDEEGSLWLWGKDLIADSLVNGSVSAEKVLDDVQTADFNFLSAAVIQTDGSLWMWGNNEHGQLGDGTTAGFADPLEILDDVAAVSCGTYVTAAIKTDGSLWTWGYNEFGQLGNGGTADSPVPVKIMDGVTAVDCGAYHIAALKEDGTVWTWGKNDSGQLGNGTTENSSVPIQIMDGAAAVSCGTQHTAVLKTDGSVWTWGFNEFGGLGNGTTTQSPVPVKAFEDAVSISCGATYTAAIKADGSLWMWGCNATGQLGTGTTEHSLVPVQVMEDVSYVAGGWVNTVVVKTDGSVWGWGSNTFGQLADGTPENSLIPIRLPFTVRGGAAEFTASPEVPPVK